MANYTLVEQKNGLVVKVYDAQPMGIIPCVNLGGDDSRTNYGKVQPYRKPAKRDIEAEIRAYAATHPESVQVKAEHTEVLCQPSGKTFETKTLKVWDGIPLTEAQVMGMLPMAEAMVRSSDDDEVQEALLHVCINERNWRAEERISHEQWDAQGALAGRMAARKSAVEGEDSLDAKTDAAEVHGEGDDEQVEQEFTEVGADFTAEKVPSDWREMVEELDAWNIKSGVKLKTLQKRFGGMRALSALELNLTVKQYYQKCLAEAKHPTDPRPIKVVIDGKEVVWDPTKDGDPESARWQFAPSALPAYVDAVEVLSHMEDTGYTQVKPITDKALIALITGPVAMDDEIEQEFYWGTDKPEGLSEPAFWSHIGYVNVAPKGKDPVMARTVLQANDPQVVRRVRTLAGSEIADQSTAYTSTWTDEGITHTRTTGLYCRGGVDIEEPKEWGYAYPLIAQRFDQDGECVAPREEDVPFVTTGKYAVEPTYTHRTIKVGKYSVDGYFPDSRYESLFVERDVEKKPVYLPTLRTQRMEFVNFAEAGADWDWNGETLVELDEEKALLFADVDAADRKVNSPIYEPLAEGALAEWFAMRKVSAYDRAFITALIDGAGVTAAHKAGRLGWMRDGQRKATYQRVAQWLALLKARPIKTSAQDILAGKVPEAVLAKGDVSLRVVEPVKFDDIDGDSLVSTGGHRMSVRDLCRSPWQCIPASGDWSAMLEALQTLGQPGQKLAKHVAELQGIAR